MKKSVTRFLPALLLFTVSFSIKAQTYISGFISASTNWTLAGSPYIITGNALLSQGYTLTIDPGVIVKFDTNKTLQIDGEMIAIGTALNRITFTSLQASPKAGDWGKLHFSDYSTNAVFDTLGNYISGCIMKYCDVSYGGKLGYGEIHIESSSPYISQCQIMNCSSAGIYCSGSSYLLDSSVVKNCLDYGLYFQNYSQNSCGLIIQGDTIQNNAKGGLYLDGSNSNCSTLIQGNFFLSNTNGGAMSVGGIGEIVISQNSFINNSGGTIIYFQNEISEDTIECNIFLNNKGTAIRYWGYSSGLISHNIFDGDTGQYSVIIVAARDLIFQDNIIRNNSASTECCDFVPSINGVNLLSIDHNAFYNNTTPIVVHVYGVQTNNVNLNFLHMKFNSFLDPNAKYEFANGVPYGSPNVYADSNYWGSTNTQHIDSVIDDYFDFGNLSVVYYQSILMSSPEMDTSCAFPHLKATLVPSISAANYSRPFPNPFSSYSTLTFKDELKDASLLMYNVFGQKVKSMEHINANSIRIERENLVSGIYIYEVVEKQRRVTSGKLVIE